MMRLRFFWSALVSLLAPLLAAAPTHLVEEPPITVQRLADGVYLLDFGRVAFGNLRLEPPVGTQGAMTIHFGEAMADGRILRRPPGSVRYARTVVSLPATFPVIAAPAADARNTRQVRPDEKPDQYGQIAPSAVLTPPEWGVVLPFRWVEVEGWPGELRAGQVQRRAAYAATWDDTAAQFRSSDPTLDRIWELCRYSIKATTFAGVYVDGDRERIPYEADAYLNQLSHYTTDPDIAMARDTFDHLMKNPTWPTEWASHLIFMVHADWRHTGDRNWLAARFEALKPKLLLHRARADGLIASNAATLRKGDLVDWPVTERDGFVLSPLNVVVNAFHLRSLALMAELARALGKDAEARAYAAREREVRVVFQEEFYDPVKGAYRDGAETDHYSLHASLFPLAFGLVPEAERARVTRFVLSRGMACSVYAAQYLLEGLFMHGADREALALMIAPGDRSWRHMLESGTTITWEAWDQRYKPNQDWNHAWGAAPANLLPRFVLGVQPDAPGWSRALIRPLPGGLASASGKVPTPRGPIQVSWEATPAFRLTFSLPPGIPARVELPAAGDSHGVRQNQREVSARRVGERWVVEEVSGQGRLEVW